MPLCGLKCSYFGLILSIWGFVQLALTGFFFHVHSVALVEDVPLPRQDYLHIDELRTDLDTGYSQSAYNCWIAALLYLATFCLSAQQYYLHWRVRDIQAEAFSNFDFSRG